VARPDSTALQRFPPRVGVLIRRLWLMLLCFGLVR